MIEWVKRLFHFHEWETEELKIVRKGTDTVIGIKYVQTCKVCGKIKITNNFVYD